jgi:hypothetical protein
MPDNAFIGKKSQPTEAEVAEALREVAQTLDSTHLRVEAQSS